MEIPQELKIRISRIRLVAFDFDGVFTDNSVYVNQNGEETVRCWRGDGIGLQALARLGIETIIISTEPNPVVTARSRKLRIPCIQGCPDKKAELQRLAAEKNLRLDEIAFVGNDINDLCCLESVGLPIVVNDAHPSVIGAAAYRTETEGGFGAVREVCDLFCAVIGASIQNGDKGTQSS